MRKVPSPPKAIDVEETAPTEVMQRSAAPYIAEAPTVPVASAPYDPSDPHTLLGRTVGGGKYRIESLLGVGSMGAVFRARQLALDKLVAVKVMLGEIASRPELAARFQREARAASLFDHPNSVRVTDFGQDDDGLCFIAMELVDGRDLQQLVAAHGPIENRRAARIVADVLGVLARAHDAGIVHRDVKPENILLVAQADDDGTPIDVVKVCDFGIAKVRDERVAAASPSRGPVRITADGLVVGTPEYMSPEQAQGDTVDLRSDIYSCGVVLYYMLTAGLPFEGETAVKVIIGHVTRTPDPPSSKNPDVDPRFDAVCMKAMAKRPADRYETAREMRRDLRAILGDRALDASAKFTSPGKRVPTTPPPPALTSSVFRAPESARGGRALLYAGIASGVAGASLIAAALVPRLYPSSPSTTAAVRRPPSAVNDAVESPAKIELALLPVRFAASPPLRAGEGRIFVETAPGAACRVLVDGKERGAAPTGAIDLPEGWHVIGCVDDDGGVRGGDVHVEAQAAKRVGIFLRP